jgi:alkanesulfonate monooxygenase SsuD/methylene tetrahydromethanopterin reductase-like flavin-dependent oxidoreductase (luciferase family)
MAMKIGIALPSQVTGVTRADVIGYAQRAEGQGLDSLWSLDRLVYPSLAPLTALTVAAAVTERVNLGTSILLGTLWNPMLLAKEVASIQTLSEGRFILGMAIGARDADFEAAAVPMKGRPRRLEEMMAVLRPALRGAPVDHDGRVFRMRVGPVALAETPPTPIWLGGFAEPAIRRAVELGDGFILGGRGPEYGRQMVPVVRELAAKAGKDGSRFPVTGLMYGCFDPDVARATSTMTRYIEAYYGRLIFDPVKHAICGGPREAVARIEDYAAAGIDTLVIVPVLRDPGQVERLAEAAAIYRENAK